MKYWNKQLRYRKQWTEVIVTLSREDSRYYLVPPPRHLKLWCQRDESEGKFYIATTGQVPGGFGYRFQFEIASDASRFATLWGIGFFDKVRE